MESLRNVDGFLAALHQEIDLRSSDWSAGSVGTLFFGGGTPSLLTPSQIGRILDHFQSVFHFDSDVEMTLESNPGTIDRAKLRGYRDAGINRLSIGIQSFDEAELKFLGRIHDRDQAIKGVREARMAGFENLNIDLIYALPGQSLDGWKTTLGQALQLSPDHVSAYGLIVEDRTPLSGLVKSKQISPTSPDEEAEFFELTMNILGESGFEHYEISNYARPGYRCRHNLNYWKHGDYLGFGPSAHSYRSSSGEGHRWWNVASISSYLTQLKEGRLPVVGEERLGLETTMVERVFLGLRSDGIDTEEFTLEFGERLLDARRGLIQELVGEGFLRETGNRLSLTSKGYLVCDEVSLRLTS